MKLQTSWYHKKKGKCVTWGSRLDRARFSYSFLARASNELIYICSRSLSFFLRLYKSSQFLRRLLSHFLSPCHEISDYLHHKFRKFGQVTKNSRTFDPTATMCRWSSRPHQTLADPGGTIMAAAPLCSLGFFFFFLEGWWRPCQRRQARWQGRMTGLWLGENYML